MAHSVLTSKNTAYASYDLKSISVWPSRRTETWPKLDETAWTTSTHRLCDNDDGDDDDDDDDDGGDDLSAVSETVQKVRSVSKC